MKILFVVNEGFFFVSHRLPVARAAAKAGLNVHVAAPDDHVWAAEGFSNEAIEREGFTFHRIRLSRRGMNPFMELSAVWSILVLFRRTRPDLVHLITIKPVLYGGIAARLAGVPAVVFAITGLGHLFVAHDWYSRLVRRLVVRLYKLALRHRRSAVVVQNASDAATIQRFGIGRHEQFHLIEGSGVDLDVFSPSPERPGVPIVVLPARMIWEKGIKEFVEAATICKRNGVVARWVLIGGTHPSNERAVPEEQLRRWVDSEVVEWWGRREDMPGLLASAHVVCQPSKYGEGIPKVILEAAASARAIVTSDVPGCCDFVEDDVNGLIVPSGNASALASAVTRLLESDDLRQRLGRAARGKVENGFGVESVVRRTLDLYGALDHGLFRERNQP